MFRGRQLFENLDPTLWGAWGASGAGSYIQANRAHDIPRFRSRLQTESAFAALVVILWNHSLELAFGMAASAAASMKFSDGKPPVEAMPKICWAVGVCGRSLPQNVVLRSGTWTLTCGQKCHLYFWRHGEWHSTVRGLPTGIARLDKA